MPQAIKVFTPIKRVPTMIGKAQNGQKLPFGPYTLPQVVAAIVMILITSVLAMSLPVNPAITFIGGLVLTIGVVFAIGLVPYTGVRMTSRILWIARLILVRKPISASGMPITGDSARDAVFVEESVVVIFPDVRPAQRGPARTPLIVLPETWVETAIQGGTALPQGGY
ncbi:hypothetical protein KO481_35440 [Nocardia sp. NEAU-G5]|uniref:PH domain-containing protein n=1 Tax=Nocardia albiluteola TaxID=2842303 RepID=A0ABS6B919_9NOCA|nr:hypothetical protein [Nocardia albiluteola]MBU3066800.1 hypothetical protein [Nocardia albiluteola]